MIRIRVAMPECGRTDLNDVDSSYIMRGSLDLLKINI
jgi:hypothetical protein